MIRNLDKGDEKRDSNLEVDPLLNIFSFNDLYIVESDISKSYCFYIKKNERILISEEQLPLVTGLYKAIIDLLKDNPDEEDLMVIFKERYFRCMILDTVTGRKFICRQMPIKFVDMDDTGIPPSQKNILLSEKYNSGGLIIICGSPGNGKTTSCAAIIAKRLELYGGMCLTAEDPNEIPLDGPHGKGMCIQTKVKKGESFADRIRQLMRAYPTSTNNLMLIGETRDADTAEQVLKASLDGRLVLTTMHADSLENAISRMVALASDSLGFEEASKLLGSSFRIALHQKLIQGEASLDTQILYSNPKVSSLITNGKIDQLGTEIDLQAAQLRPK